jgi:predicted dehydrogenase
MGALAGDALDVRPQPRDPGQYGIGVIGSGNIIENAHLPAYREAGYRVAAIASRTVDNARGVAERRGIERVHETFDALIDDPDVDIVDIAVPPDYQPEIVHKAIAAGKHVLAQKPLAVTYGQAIEMVEAADTAGVKLAVNQNGRYDPSINAARQLIADGILGTRLVAAITMHIDMPWQQYYRDPKYDKLMILHMSVHHIDQLRMLFGDPESVVAVGRRTPGEFYGDTIAQYVLQYDDGFWASSLDDGTNWSDDFAITYRIQGTDASLRGEIGWPHGRHSTLAIQRAGEGSWETPSFTRQWFPDAFSATMGALLEAVENDAEPSNSGRDNLTTMRAVFAAYRSMRDGRSVHLDEVNAQED